MALRLRVKAIEPRFRARRADLKGRAQGTPPLPPHPTPLHYHRHTHWKQKWAWKSAFYSSFPCPTRTKPAFHNWFPQTGAWTALKPPPSKKQEKTPEKKGIPETIPPPFFREPKDPSQMSPKWKEWRSTNHFAWVDEMGKSHVLIHIYGWLLIFPKMGKSQRVAKNLSMW